MSMKKVYASFHTDDIFLFRKTTNKYLSTDEMDKQKKIHFKENIFQTETIWSKLKEMIKGQIVLEENFKLKRKQNYRIPL